MARLHFLRVMDGLAVERPPVKFVMIEFHPADPPDEHTLFSDAPGSQIEPVLESVLARLRAGDLRMPINGGCHWTDDATE